MGLGFFSKGFSDSNTMSASHKPEMHKAVPATCGPCESPSEQAFNLLRTLPARIFSAYNLQLPAALDDRLHGQSNMTGSNQNCWHD